MGRRRLWICFATKLWGLLQQKSSVFPFWFGMKIMILIILAPDGRRIKFLILFCSLTENFKEILILQFNTKNWKLLLSGWFSYYDVILECFWKIFREIFVFDLLRDTFYKFLRKLNFWIKEYEYFKKLKGQHLFCSGTLSTRTSSKNGEPNNKNRKTF